MTMWPMALYISWYQFWETPAYVPAIRLTPHIQLIVVLSTIRKQDEFPIALELSGHLHAQSERLQTEGFLRNHLHVAGAGLGGEDQAFAVGTHWQTGHHHCSNCKTAAQKQLRLQSRKGMQLHDSAEMTATRTNPTGIILSKQTCENKWHNTVRLNNLKHVFVTISSMSVNATKQAVLTFTENQVLLPDAKSWRFLSPLLPHPQLCNQTMPIFADCYLMFKLTNWTVNFREI